MIQSLMEDTRSRRQLESVLGDTINDSAARMQAWLEKRTILPERPELDTSRAELRADGDEEGEGRGDKLTGCLTSELSFCNIWLCHILVRGFSIGS
jgi:hypothetical protein